ncbi:hypothetical protein SAMN05216474_0012 [Lishizhenia tianjinensis]|uniref:Uncharacterized protein n=1 Tax=Lishizhenia tianjinensis TaxID=477690 RepID=A0A1I6X908_9FLAO|nr:hypothetical protein SAMN05216474_0012 [Lishizhenia tianjinensis]
MKKNLLEVDIFLILFSNTIKKGAYPPVFKVFSP